MQLSKNFTLDEFLKLEYNKGRGFDNSPQDPNVIINAQALATNVLQKVREHFDKPVSITSGYRCPDLNKHVGGAKSSQHTTGEAADIQVDGVPAKDVAKWIRDNLTFDQVIYEVRGKIEWVHVSYSRKKNRKEVLSSIQSGYTQGIA